MWPHFWNAADRWEIDWEQHADDHPTKAEVAAALAAHHGASQHSDRITLLCCVCVPFRPAARTAWATDLPAVFHLPHSRCGSLVTQPRS